MKKKHGPEPVDIHVGNRIKMQRRIRGLSQMALANGLGLTFQQVQKYEYGKNRVSSSRLQQIANILKVPVPFFFEGVEGTVRSKQRDYQAEISNTTGGLQLARAFTRIKRKQVRRSIVSLVEIIADSKAARRD